MSRACILLSLLAAGCAFAGGSGRLPAPEAEQLRLRDSDDAAAMRRHAWTVFAGVTRPRRDGRPAFAGWAPLRRTFGGGAPGGGLGLRLVEEPESVGIPLRQASGAPLLSLVLFNGPAFRHIRSQRLYSRARLDRLNAGFGTAAPLAARRIAPFPRDAMSMKTIWTIVHADGLTPVSVWDGTGDAAGANPPEHWPRIVLVDPAHAGGGTRTMVLAGRTYADARVVSLDRFYHVAIGAADLDSVRAIDPSARPGDYLALLGMHLTTKEIPDWIWATYWWHDRPDAGPYAADRPDALAGAWRNYLMDATYSMESPAEADGAPNTVFNPYVEVFAAGMRSNCMACHQGAVWTAAGAPAFLPVTRGARRPGDPRFAGAMRLDFMWSLATEAR